MPGVNARRKWKKAKQQVLSLSEVVQEVWLDLRAAGMDVRTIQDVPEAVKALVEMARAGGASNVDVVVESTSVELYAVPGPASGLVPFGGDEDEDEMPMLQDVEYGLDGEPIRMEASQVRVEQPVAASPGDFARAANEKMKARLAHVAQHGVHYRPVGMGGLKTGPGLIPNPVPKPTLAEQRAILEGAGMIGKPGAPQPPRPSGPVAAAAPPTFAPKVAPAVPSAPAQFRRR